MKQPIIVVACLLHASWLLAQPGGGPPAEVAAAQKLYQATDYKGAIAALESYFAANPANQAGYQVLGNAYRKTGDLDKALRAHTKDAGFRLSRLRGTFNSAIIQNLKGDKDAAFSLLRTLRASGSFDMDLVKADPDLASLRDDARFAALSFQPEEFERPFVEPVRVIHEWRGENKNDYFGWIARGVGDVDGDGVNDIVTSSPGFVVDGQPAGKVYVYSGKGGKLIWSAVGAKGESLGQGLEGAGDINADGVPDVIAGSPSSDKAYVYDGRTGRVLRTLSAGAKGALFGNAASFAGDVDRDGHADVVVGAPGGQSPGADPGHAYVFSGKTGAVLTTLTGEKPGEAFGSIVAGSRDRRHPVVLVGAPGAGAKQAGRAYVFPALATTPKFVIDNDETGFALGYMFLSAVGDVDKDGVFDVYVADFSHQSLGPATGRVFVHSGATGRRLHTFSGDASGDAFGVGSADVGDVNGDHHDDLIIGAWQVSAAAPSGGRFSIYSGRDGTVLRTVTGRIAGDTLGFDATGVGDIDGDGRRDYLVPSASSQVNGFRSGRMYVIAGEPFPGATPPATGRK